jgi:hypothetical protein
MSASVLLRCAAALALGAGAGYAAWVRVGATPPSLEIRPVRTLTTENFDLWDLRVTARGGETIEHVRVEPLSPRLHLVGPGTFDGLRSGWTKTFRLQLDDPKDAAVLAVRVWQEGPVSNTYDLVVGGPR